MVVTIRGKIAMRLLRLIPSRVARCFLREQDGAAAIEFALVAIPFLALIFAILETALVFWAGQTLETAATDSARLIMTGQAQMAGYSQSDFKNAVCGRIYGLFDCSGGLSVDVKSYTSFSAVNPTPPISNGKLDPTKTGYDPGNVGSIVSVTLYYQWPIYVPMLDKLTTAGLAGGTRLLVATAVFRNEPYK